jgi:polyhydroxybutyrate depolymerase
MTPRALVFLVALLATACGSGEGSGEVADTTTSTSIVEADSILSTSQQVQSAAAPTTVREPEPDPTTTTTTTEARRFDPISLQPECSAIGRVPVGLQTGTIESGGVEYNYQWTVPSSYDGTPLAVVLDFHGVGSNGAHQAVFSGWAAKAEREGFLSVQPTGIKLPPDDRPSWELPQFESPERDDVVMVVDLLEHVAANVCINPAQVYATGMANGGFFTSEVICDLSDRIAAAVSVAGVTHDESCAPVRPVPYLAFHGTADGTVPFRGDGETTLEGVSAAFFEQVMPDEFGEFAADFGCTESTDAEITTEVTLTSWTGCDDDIEMGFYALEGAGHTWPGSVISSETPSLGVTNMDVDATGIAWDFFQRHSLLSEEDPPK